MVSEKLETNGWDDVLLMENDPVMAHPNQPSKSIKRYSLRLKLKIVNTSMNQRKFEYLEGR